MTRRPFYSLLLIYTQAWEVYALFSAAAGRPDAAWFGMMNAVGLAVFGIACRCLEGARTMGTKTVSEHRNYPDAEVEYDVADPEYDDTGGDADRNDQVDADSGDPLEADSGFPAPDVFPDTLFNDDPRAKPKRGPGHGDS